MSHNNFHHGEQPFQQSVHHRHLVRVFHKSRRHWHKADNSKTKARK